MEKKCYFIPKDSLNQLFERVHSGGSILIAPHKSGDRVLFEKVSKFEEVDTTSIVPAISAKTIVFPKAEVLFSFDKTKEGTHLENRAEAHFREVVLWGCRPCDAKAFEPLTEVFNGDYPDEIFNGRKKQLVVISIGCSKSDQHCFCTSVQIGPDSKSGSDLFLTEYTSGGYNVEIVTDKGDAFVERFADLFVSSVQGEALPYAEVPVLFDVANLPEKLREVFENPVWAEMSKSCLGCAACAYICPICSCFDIQDEKHGNKGVRLRCWDACSLGQFTLHTSGHNPRESQGTRWRQRLMHKFRYMPEKMELHGCVGCGRCVRSCPAGNSIIDAIYAIQTLK